MEIKEHKLLLFIKLYEEEFGVTLTRDDAHEKALLLLQYGRLFMPPLAEVKEDDINDMSYASK